MKLQQINKQRYREHLNKVIIGCIVLLASLSLGISTTVIYLFTDGEGTHFWLNLLGVAMAVVIIWQLLRHYQDHDYLTEVKYVWDLKQELNLITRVQRKVQAAADDNHPDALLAQLFAFEGSKQVYQLDDNTITMSELNQKHDALLDKIASLKLSLSVDDYHRDLLKQFK